MKESCSSPGMCFVQVARGKFRLDILHGFVVQPKSIPLELLMKLYSQNALPNLLTR